MTWEAVKNQFAEGIDEKSKDIIIDNVSGISREGKATKFSRIPQLEGQNVKKIILNKEGVIFDFFTTKTDEKIFDQALSTFKFLNTPSK